MSAQKSKRKGNAKSGVSRAELQAWLNETLQPEGFKDYCPNGLQVQGSERISHLVAGVTASLQFLRAAKAAGADAVLVHHGWFWRGEDPRLIGLKYARLEVLMSAQINLFGYHLPLDAHPEHGNNAQLAERLGWPVSGRAGPGELVFYADLEHPISVDQLGRLLGKRLGQKPLLVGRTGEPSDKRLSRLAWCTGGAQDYIETAIEIGADAFISGEISERTTHTAREAGLVYAAAGHHATERFGVQALGEAAADALGLTYEFIDDPNPA